MKLLIRVFLLVLTAIPRATSHLLKFIQEWCGVFGKQAGFNAIVSAYHQTSQSFFDKLYISKVDKAHAPEKLTYLDIGARGGLIEVVKINEQLFDKTIVVEGEPVEAKRLREMGHLVIDRFLSDKVGEAVFYDVTECQGASSLKQPPGPFFDLHSYGTDNDYYKLHERYETARVETSTVDLELERLGVERIDLAKLDVQGCETDIIKGMTKLKPLFWVIEIQYLPMYFDTPFGVDIIQEMHSRGYVKFHDGCKSYREGIVQWSDGYFMPNWTDPKGIALITANLARWETLMRMFAQHKLLQFIKRKLKLPDRSIPA